MRNLLTKATFAVCVALCASSISIPVNAQEKSKYVEKEKEAVVTFSSLRQTPAAPQKAAVNEPKDGWITWMQTYDPNNGIGTGSANDFTVAVRWDATEMAAYAGQNLTMVGFGHNQDACEYTLQVYTGGNWAAGTGAPGTLAHEQDITGLPIGQMNEITLTSPVVIPAGEELWIAVRCNTTTGHPAGVDGGPAVGGKGNLMYFNGAWAELTSLGDLNYNWAIKGYLQGELLPVPGAVTDFTVTPDPDLGLSATLSWNNPTTAFDGSELTSITSVIVKRNGEQITEITTGCTPGAAMTYVDEAVPAAGNYTYSVQCINEVGPGGTSTYTATVGPLFIMPATGTMEVNACGGFVYDDGGADANYSNSCNATLVLNPSQPNKGICLNGTYDIENNYDKLYVYEGPEALDANLIATLTGTGTVDNLSSQLGAMTLKFTSDGSVPKAGFELAVSCVDVNTSCLPPYGLSSTNASDTQIDLAWLTLTNETEWNIEYGPRGFTQGEGTTVTATTRPYTLTGLTPATSYDFFVQANCGADGVSAWSSRGSFATAVACAPGTEAVLVTIGNGTTGAYTMPVNTFYKYSVTQQIISAEELSAQGAFMGLINTIGYQYIYSDAQTKTNCKIYMGHSIEPSFASGATFTPVEEMELVYEGDMTFEAGLEWNEFLLTTPFMYDGASSLIITVINNDGAYLNSSNTFYTHTTEATTSLRAQNDNNAYDPATLPTVTATAAAVRNNMRVGMCIMEPEYVAVSGTLTGSLYNVPLANVPVRFRGALGGTVTTDAAGQFSIELVQGIDYEVTASAPSYNDFVGTYSAPAAATAEYNFSMTRPVVGAGPVEGINVTTNFLVNTTATVTVANWGDGPMNWKANIVFQDTEMRNEPFSFEEDLEGWTTIDANGDGHCWYHTTAAGGHNVLVTESHTGVGHMMSESFCNYLQGALTPNDYLVSPQQYSIAGGSSVTLWAAGQDAEYAAEHFSVAVSTASEPTAADFVDVQEWTIGQKRMGKPGQRGAQDASPWLEYTADLSAFAGQDCWIAIHHFGVTDQFILIVDDVTINAGAGSGPWLSINEKEGSVAAHNAEVLELTFNAGYADHGTYHAQVVFSTENPNVGEAAVDVTFTINPPACDAPTALSATIANFNDATLTWSAPANATGLVGYNLYAAGATVAIAELGNVTTHTIMDLNPGSYSYDVRARFDDGCISMAATSNVIEAVMPQGNLAGTVVDGATDEAIEGAVVTINGTEYTTNAQGAFTVADIEIGQYAVTAVAEWFKNYTGTVTIVEGANTLAIEMEAIECGVPTDLAATVNNGNVNLTWSAPTGDMAIIIMEAHDVWGDGSGYHIVLDADANEFGVTIPATGAMYSTCNPPADYYDVFEFKAPETATPSCSSDVVVDGTAQVLVPAGIYDYAIVNPTPGDKLWIAAGDNGRRDNYEFEAGKTYRFIASLGASGNDQIEIVVSNSKDVAVNDMFNVYRDGEMIASNVAATTYTDANMTHGTYQYYVTTVCREGESDPSNVVNATVGIDDVMSNNFKVFPNPANALLNIEFEGNFTNVEVINLLGQVVMNAEVAGNTATIDVSSLSESVYYLRLTGNGNSAVTKFVKQ